MRRGLLFAAVVALTALVLYWFSPSASTRRSKGESQSRVSGCGKPPAEESSERARPPDKTVRDAARRAEIREQLREKLGTRFPSATPSAKPVASQARPPAPTKPRETQPGDDEPSKPGIEPRYIQERVREDFFPLARDCYDQVLKRTPKRAGKVSLHFTIVGDEAVGGIVETSTVGEESTLVDDEFNTCLQESMMVMTFPPPNGGGSVSVIYPIEFSPGDDDDDAAPPQKGAPAPSASR